MVIPIILGEKQEDYEFKATLGCTARAYCKTRMRNKNKPKNKAAKQEISGTKRPRETISF